MLRSQTLPGSPDGTGPDYIYIGVSGKGVGAKSGEELGNGALAKGVLYTVKQALIGVPIRFPLRVQFLFRWVAGV